MGIPLKINTSGATDVFNTQKPYGGTNSQTPISGNYNNPQGTGSTRVIGGAGISSPLKTNPATNSGIIGSINNLGKNLSTTPLFQGINAVLGTNYGNTNPTHATGDFLTANQNTAPAASNATKTNVGAMNTGNGINSSSPKTEQQIHDEKLKVLDDQLADVKKKAKVIQDGMANGTMDTNGNTITPSVNQNVNQSSNQQTSTDIYKKSAAGLLGLGATQDPEYLNAMQKVKNLGIQEGNAVTDIGNEPMTNGSQAGQIGTVRGTLENEMNAQTNYGNAILKGREQQQTALSSAAGATSPVNQLGLLTDTSTGLPLNPTVANNAIQQAYDMYKNGTPINDPQLQALIAPFSTWGQQQFNSMVNSGGTNMSGGGAGFNPASQSAAANQNIQQGVDTGGQAYQVNLAFKQIATLAPMIKNFLADPTVGINPSDAQTYNAQINTYLDKIQASGQMTQWQIYMSELNRYTSQLIGTGSLTPTGITTAAQLMNPSNLSLRQIDAVLNTLSDVGNNQLYNLQTESANSLNGSKVYSGSTTSPVTASAPAPKAAADTPGGNVNSTAGKWFSGNVLNVADDMAGIAAAGTALFKWIGSW